MSQNENNQPPGMDVSDDSRPDVGNGDQGSLGRADIGAFLRDGREKKGLSLAQISESTKLRPYILEALENEDWDRLPSPAFVRGFIRSYALALGLEEGKAIILYQKTAPAEASSPKPLVDPVKSRKTLFVTLIFLLLVIISFYYLWKGYSISERVSTSPEAIPPVGDNVMKSKPIQELQKRTEAVPSIQQNEEELAHKADPEVVDLQTPDGPLEENLEENEEIKISPAISPAAGGIEPPELTLKVNVREKTWIRIFVDNSDPKEYVLRPGRHQEWRAKKGFELLVGNAGGIDFEFNDEIIENFGTPGQVVRIRFPKGYERRRSQD